MNKENIPERTESSEQDIVLISKIYESFEALEETLGKLKLEEPLFITHVAKNLLPTPSSVRFRKTTTGKSSNGSKTDN